MTTTIHPYHPPAPPPLPGPPPLPRRPTMPLPRHTWPLAAIVVVGGVIFDLAVRVPTGVGLTLWVLTLAAAIAVVIIQGEGAPPVRVLAPLLATVVFAGFLSIRTSPWLVPLDLLAAFGLLGAAVVADRGGNPWSLGLLTGLTWVGRGIEALCLGPVRLVQLVGRVLPRTGTQRTAALTRSLLLAVPILGVVGALLVSADAFLASYLRADINGPSVFTHGLLIVVGAWLAVSAILPLRSDLIPNPTATGTPPSGSSPSQPPGQPRRLGTTEAAVLLGGLAVLFTLFVTAAVGAALAGDSYVQTQTGLTYAEYARRGFFQLLAVAAITFVVLVAVRARTAPSRLLTALGLVDALLIGAVVAVAVRRLGLYEQAYGATMLRLFSTWFAWWLGAVFAVVALAWAGAFRSRNWLGAAVCGLALLWLAAVNVVNPEAVAVRRNIAHAERTGTLDLDYLTDLRADATPELVASLDRVGPDADNVVFALCDDDHSGNPLAWNWSRQRADDAVADLCR